jgi:Cu2+-exporting ATPase
MSLSSFCVVSNALRLNWFRLYDESSCRGRKSPVKLPNLNDFAAAEVDTEENDAKLSYRLQIDGMMCTHCEASVKKALESVEGILNAEADWQTGIALAKASRSISEEQLRLAVEAEDYSVKSVERVDPTS